MVAAEDFFSDDNTASAENNPRRRAITLRGDAAAVGWLMIVLFDDE